MRVPFRFRILGRRFGVPFDWPRVPRSYAGVLGYVDWVLLAMWIGTPKEKTLQNSNQLFGRRRKRWKVLRSGFSKEAT